MNRDESVGNVAGFRQIRGPWFWGTVGSFLPSMILGPAQPTF